MATHSNRSPSPLSSRPTNPNPRNFENNPSVRRSFSGNSSFAKPSALTNQRRFDPITPANSPSDFARRRSVGVEGTAPPHLKDCEEKENDDKDCVLKASKLQPSGKGCKSFMAPTISAASKFTPSPRKKVLVERNDPVRTSITLSEGKAMFFSAISDAAQDLEPETEVGHHQNPKNEAFSESSLVDFEDKKAVLESHHVSKPLKLESPHVSKPLKKVTFSEIPSESTESVITDVDSSKLESKVGESPTAPLDAGPSPPPYDPKTNYLSPRPQFIRYKPNPRVEMLLNKEKALLQPDELEATLMAEIMSEGFSDSGEGTDESQCEDSSKEEMEVTSSQDMVIGLDEEIESDAPKHSESLPASTTPVEEISEEGLVHKNEKKGWSLTRLVSFSMLMILLVSVYVRGVPSFDEKMIIDLSFSDMSNLYEQYSRAAVDSARLGFGSVAGRADHVWATYVSPILKVVEGENRVPVQFVNLTELQENTLKEAYFLKQVEEYDGLEIEEEDKEEEYAAQEDVLDTETEILKEEEEEAYAEEDHIVATEETRFDSAKIADLKLESESYQDVDNQTGMVFKEVEEDESAAVASQNQEKEVEAAAAAVAEVAVNEKSEARIHLETSEESLNMPMAGEAEESLITGHVVGIIISSSFFGAVLLGVAALIYYKKSPSSGSVVRVETMRENISTTEKEQPIIQQEKEPSETWVTRSEMSSSYRSQIGNEEVESSDRKTTSRRYSRRESLASSSGFPAGSTSYGSFTTYERVPVKINGYGEEEVMTPVRRSSRIKNLVTSPL